MVFPSLRSCELRRTLPGFARAPNAHATSDGRAALRDGGRGRTANGASRWGQEVATDAAIPLYIRAMSASLKPQRPRGLATVFGWRRLLLAVGLSVLFGLLNSAPPTAPRPLVTVGHALVVGLAAVLAFGLLEQWPRRPPSWLPRWVMQLGGVVIAVPLGVLAAHSVSMAIDMHASHESPQMTALIALLVEGLLFGPWIALGAMVRQRDLFARHQALAFQLERSELEREASEARLRLLQAQVKPHFLFNTLANVQALVDSGSPRASSVLRSLVAYLRAAMPRLQESTTTIGQEVELAQAYLEVMHMRMPDRLRFTLRVDEDAAGLGCPPMTLLTLVENAVRHGIDPGEEGGRIDVDVSVLNGRCSVRVTDTGVGLQPSARGLGTGLTALRERLQLAFGGDADLRLESIQPRGARASLEFPAQKQAA
jgi:signal transduction histidine kinase